jgi:hypothetical protein
MQGWTRPVSPIRVPGPRAPALLRPGATLMLALLAGEPEARAQRGPADAAASRAAAGPSAAAAPAPAPAAATPPPAPGPLQIASLEAFLFAERTGQVGKDNVAIAVTERAIPPALIRGEGQDAAGGPSSGLLVVVAVAGGADRHPASLSLTASVQGKTVRREWVRGHALSGALTSSEGSRHYPFVVRGVECATVTLIAELHGAGAGADKRVKRLVPFRCPR